MAPKLTETQRLVVTFLSKLREYSKKTECPMCIKHVDNECSLIIKHLRTYTPKKLVTITDSINSLLENIQMFLMIKQQREENSDDILQEACDYTKKTVVALKPFAEKYKSKEYLSLSEGLDEELTFDDMLMYCKKCVLIIKDIWKAKSFENIMNDPNFSVDKMNKILDVHDLI